MDAATERHPRPTPNPGATPRIGKDQNGFRTKQIVNCKIERPRLHHADGRKPRRRNRSLIGWSRPSQHRANFELWHIEDEAFAPRAHRL